MVGVFSAGFCIFQQRIELLAAHLDDGAMLVVGGHADAFGDGGEGQEVAGRYGTIFLWMVLVEVWSGGCCRLHIRERCSYVPS